MRKFKVIIILVLVGIGLNSCVTVEPWEREQLSKPIMIMDKNPIEKGIQIHHLEYREGSAGATGSQSGGCGCG
jgi:hypothetical protein